LLGGTVASIGSPLTTSQWSKTHCGNAWPPVAAREAEALP
jgi:hypothetical protein